MIRSSPRSGFTLIEVMISLAIVGLVLTSLGGLQMALLRATMKSTGRFERLRSMLFFLEDSRIKESSSKEQERGKKITKELKEPALKLTYERFAPAKKSSLYRQKDLKIERVTGEWKGATRKQQDSIITFIYTPELEDETGNKPA